MKALPFILALVSVPGLVAEAAEKAGAVEGMLPTNGVLQPGVLVHPTLSPGFIECVKQLNESLKNIAPEKRTAYLAKFKLDEQPEYDDEIWPDKADYDRFVDEWRKTELRPVSRVAVGLQEMGNGIWRVLSVEANGRSKQATPLNLSALRYDANRNVWLSSNGELTASNYSVSDNSLYGAQIGTEWVLDKTDDLTTLHEMLRITKTTDGKHVYVNYVLSEKSSITGNSIAQRAYTLQFNVPTTGTNLGTPGTR